MANKLLTKKKTPLQQFEPLAGWSQKWLTLTAYEFFKYMCAELLQLKLSEEKLSSLRSALYRRRVWRPLTAMTMMEGVQGRLISLHE